MFGIKPQIPVSLKLGLLRDNAKNCISEYCSELPPHTHCSYSCKNEKIDNLLQNRLSSTVLQRENEFKKIYVSTYTRCRQVTNRAHYYRNRFKLGKAIPIGNKVLLENHSKNLLKSKKLQELRSGPYTVVRQITNTTYEIQDDKTEQKRIVHRNHLVPYFPKERTMSSLVDNYNPVYQEPELFYDNYHKDIVDKYNTASPLINSLYTPWPICPNVESSSNPPNIGTTEIGTNTINNQPVDSGMGTMHLRTLFSPNNTESHPQCSSFNPPHISTPYPKDKTPFVTPNSSPENTTLSNQVSPSASLNVTRQLFPQENSNLNRQQRNRRPPDRYMNPVPSSLVKHFTKK